ncbi:hypothetical protein C2S52_006543 [Perilla frutescens var. hirtella]|nr:hypothetical protein C2S51_009264 [Perilla frutescens var. frutescens]KAH6786991.1 hypothetical protein C2S52_006543 [Perilla frutescens var. hirtella]
MLEPQPHSQIPLYSVTPSQQLKKPLLVNPKTPLPPSISQTVADLEEEKADCSLTEEEEEECRLTDEEEGASDEADSDYLLKIAPADLISSSSSSSDAKSEGDILPLSQALAQKFSNVNSPSPCSQADPPMVARVRGYG